MVKLGLQLVTGLHGFLKSIFLKRSSVKLKRSPILYKSKISGYGPATNFKEYIIPFNYQLQKQVTNKQNVKQKLNLITISFM